MVDCLLRCGNCNSFFTGENANVRFCSEICHFNGYSEKQSDDLDACRSWIGPILNKHGHGLSSFKGQLSAHQRAYKMFNGPIPEGRQVNHKCKTHACVNPHHLELGDSFSNISIDRKRDGTTRKGIAHDLTSGQDNGNAKLSSKQVLEIYSSPGTYKEIAVKFPVCVGMVKRIKTGENWWLVTGHPRLIRPKKKLI
jgi:hypothetical protein